MKIPKRLKYLYRIVSGDIYSGKYKNIFPYLKKEKVTVTLMGQRQAQGLWLNGVRTSFWIVLDVDVDVDGDGNGDVEVGGDGDGNGDGDNDGDKEAQGDLESKNEDEGDLESKNEDEGVDEGEDVSEGECDGDENSKGDFFGDDDEDTCGDRADCVHVDINGAEGAAGNGESDDVTTDIDKFRGKKRIF